MIIQYTPGPWTVDANRRLTPGATIPVWSAPDDEGLRLVVCNVRANDYGDNDASLIAAARELLAALKAMVHQVEYMGAPESHPDMVAARAAIAKAESGR